MKKIIAVASTLLLATACSQAVGVMSQKQETHPAIETSSVANKVAGAPYAVKSLDEMPAVKHVKRKAADKVSEATAKAIAKELFAAKDGKVLDVSLKKSLMKTAKVELDHIEHELTDDSAVWVVTVRGQFTGAFPMTNEDGTPVVLREATAMLSAEDGNVLSARFIPVDVK